MFTIKASYDCFGTFTDEAPARRAIQRIRQHAPYGRETPLKVIPLTNDITPKPLHHSFID